MNQIYGESLVESLKVAPVGNPYCLCYRFSYLDITGVSDILRHLRNQNVNKVSDQK